MTAYKLSCKDSFHGSMGQFEGFCERDKNPLPSINEGYFWLFPVFLEY
jgi:hypothetical protein